MTAIVLVHGGSSTGAYWDLLLPHLRNDPLVIDLPGRRNNPADLMKVTLDDAAQYVAGRILGHEGDVALVAHSSGGLVVPGVVAHAAGRVRHIVLNAASVPPEGGTGIDCMREKHRDSMLLLKQLIEEGQIITSPADPPEPDRLRTAHGGDALTDDQISFLRDPQRHVTDSYNYYFAPVRWSSASGVPHTYVVNVKDRSVPLALQEEMIGRLPSQPRVIPLDTGHMPAVTMPEVLAGILDGIAAYPN